MLRILENDHYFPKFYECYESRKEFILILEFIEGGDLFVDLKK